MPEPTNERNGLASPSNAEEIVLPTLMTKNAVAEAAAKLQHVTIPFARYNSDRGLTLISVEEAVFLKAVQKWARKEGVEAITSDLYVTRPPFRHSDMIERPGILGAFRSLYGLGLFTRVGRGSYMPTPEGWKVYEMIKAKRGVDDNVVCWW